MLMIFILILSSQCTLTHTNTETRLDSTVIRLESYTSVDLNPDRRAFLYFDMKWILAIIRYTKESGSEKNYAWSFFYVVVCFVSYMNGKMEQKPGRLHSYTNFTSVVFKHFCGGSTTYKIESKSHLNQFSVCTQHFMVFWDGDRFNVSKVIMLWYYYALYDIETTVLFLFL